MKKYNLSPNPNLSLPEMFLQKQLLEQIDNFSNYSLQLDSLGKLDEYKQMWSDAMTACFTQIYDKYQYGLTL